jgi:hypothetical protein
MSCESAAPVGRSGFAIALSDAEQRAWLHDAGREIGRPPTVKDDLQWRHEAARHPTKRAPVLGGGPVNRSSRRANARSGAKRKSSPHAWRQRPPDRPAKQARVGTRKSPSPNQSFGCLTGRTHVQSGPTLLPDLRTNGHGRRLATGTCHAQLHRSVSARR